MCFLVAVLIGFLVVGCDQINSTNSFKKKAAKFSTVQTVNVMRVQREIQAVETAIFFGKLVPNRESRLGFGRAGKIKTVVPQVGDKRKKGEKLAELEQSPLETQKGEIEKAIEKAQEELQSDAQNPRAGLQQQIQQLESQLRDVEAELGKGIIEAPFDCIVAMTNANEGDLVSPQTSVFQVVENVRPQVEASLPRKVARLLNVGRSVWIGVGNQAVQAQIKTKSPLESPAGSTIITLQISNELTPGSWSFGQTVEIRFLIPTNNSGYWLPFSALNRESTGLWSALVAIQETGAQDTISENANFVVARKLLKVVQLEDDWALVQGALVDNELIIVNGSHRVVPGQPVKTNDVTGDFSKPGAGAKE